MPFVKLDCGILDSSLWSERAETCKVFLTILAMTSADGICRATAPGIASRARLSIASVQRALAVLAAPDTESRGQKEQGRRIKRIDGGYRVINYLRYRERDLTTAERSKRYRDRHGASRRDGRDESVTVTEAEAEAEAEVRSRGKKKTPPNPPVESGGGSEPAPASSPQPATVGAPPESERVAIATPQTPNPRRYGSPHPYGALPDVSMRVAAYLLANPEWAVEPRRGWLTRDFGCAVVEYKAGPLLDEIVADPAWSHVDPAKLLIEVKRRKFGEPRRLTPKLRRTYDR